MGNNSKIVMLSGLLLTMSALQSCTMFNTMGNNIRDMTGGQRTLPDNDKVDFGNRHTPELNPGGDGGSSSMDSGASGRRVPVENSASMPVSSSNVAMNAAPSVSAVPVMPVSSSALPSSSIPNGPMPSASVPNNAPDAYAVMNNTSPTQSAPAPVQRIPSTSQPGVYPQLSSVPATPAHPTAAQNRAALNAMTNDQALSESSRRALMNDTSATVMTSPQTGQLIDNAANAPAPSYNNAASTVNARTPVASNNTIVPVQVKTATLPAPMLANSPASSSPVQVNQPASSSVANNDSGFRAWLHRNVGSDSAASSSVPLQNAPSSVSVPVQTQAVSAPRNLINNSLPSSSVPPSYAASSSVPTSSVPSAMAAAPIPSSAMPWANNTGMNTPPASAQAMEPVHLHPPAVTMASIPAPPMPAQPMQAQSMPSSSIPAPAMEPVHLHPPTGMISAAPVASASPVMIDQVAAQPVHLHPPAGIASTSQLIPVSGQSASLSGYSSYGSSTSGSGRYLSDSRYAERREHVPADDVNN